MPSAITVVRDAGPVIEATSTRNINGIDLGFWIIQAPGYDGGLLEMHRSLSRSHARHVRQAQVDLSPGCVVVAVIEGLIMGDVLNLGEILPAGRNVRIFDLQPAANGGDAGGARVWVATVMRVRYAARCAEALGIDLPFWFAAGTIIEGRPISVGTSDTKRGARRAGAVSAGRFADGAEAVLEPALADVLEPAVQQPEHILTNDRVPARTAGDPLGRLISYVAGR